MRETINRSAVEVAVGSQDTKNSRGFNVGSRIQVKADAKLPKKLSYARCCTGVVARIERLITVQLDATQNFEAHCILVKPECLEHWPGQTSVAESGQVSSTPDVSTHNLTSSPPATPTTIAKISCSSDTQEPSVSEMFDWLPERVTQILGELCITLRHKSPRKFYHFKNLWAS